MSKKSIVPSEAAPPAAVSVQAASTSAAGEPIAAPAAPQSVAAEKKGLRPSIGRHRLWLNITWFVEVDDHGYLLSPCAEGALGYIIQCRSRNNQLAALKIPRLRGDSRIENAEYCQVLEREAKEVLKVDGAGSKRGIVRLAHPDSQLLCEIPNLEDAEDTKGQHGYTILVRFEKDRPARIIKVKKQSSKIAVIPNTEPLVSQIEQEIKVDSWQQHVGSLLDDHVDIKKRKPVAFYCTQQKPDESATTGQESIAGPLMEHLSAPNAPLFWYAWLPSMLFEWAQGTLQSAINTDEHQRWTPSEIYDLLGSILAGLHTLHQLGMIHGDVRPANIMACGDLASPHSYVMGDYGSFTVDLPVTPSGIEAPTGYSTPPNIARHRASSFYARERRAGVEREDAEVAVITRVVSLTSTPPSDGGEATPQAPARPATPAPLLITLTSKRRLPSLDDKRQWEARRAATQKTYHDLIAATGSVTPDSWSLSSGDQVRIRDLVFQVLAYQEDTATGDIYVACQPTFRRVMNERIVVDSKDNLFDYQRIEDVAIIDIPRWVEVRQASVASDLFGVGSIGLYITYSRAQSKINKQGNASNCESKIAGIIAKLENEENFRNLWPDLRRICSEIESAFGTFNSRNLPRSAASSSGISLAYHDAIQTALRDAQQNLSSSIDSFSSEALVKRGKNKRATNKTKSPFEEFQSDYHAVVNSLKYLVPEFEIVLSYFGSSAHFLLFVEFILCCIHRRAHLPAMESNAIEPFCANRFEKPRQAKSTSSHTAVQAALARLDSLRSQYWPNKLFFELFDSVMGVPTEGATTKIESDYQLRKKNGLLTAEIEEIKAHMEDKEAEINDITKERDANKRALVTNKDLLIQHKDLISRLQEDIAGLQKSLAFEQSRYKELANCYNQQEDELKKIVDDHADTTGKFTALQKELTDEQSQKNTLEICLSDKERDNSWIRQELTQLGMNISAFKEHLSGRFRISRVTIDFGPSSRRSDSETVHGMLQKLDAIKRRMDGLG